MILKTPPPINESSAVRRGQLVAIAEVPKGKKTPANQAKPPIPGKPKKTTTRLAGGPLQRKRLSFEN